MEAPGCVAARGFVRFFAEVGGTEMKGNGGFKRRCLCDQASSRNRIKRPYSGVREGLAANVGDDAARVNCPQSLHEVPTDSMQPFIPALQFVE
ncbi:hypothetical protein B0E51_11045 [Rhodanobacter sp. C05]|nr:hypothetical protein B0E51_11045 [Rhodanobacter sp. C05]